MKVRYTKTALAEIDEIFSYIARDNSTAADRVIGYVEHTIGLIGKLPKMGRLKYRQVVRMLPVGDIRSISYSMPSRTTRW